jgi:hypothetical protein
MAVSSFNTQADLAIDFGNPIIKRKGKIRYGTHYEINSASPAQNENCFGGGRDYGAAGCFTDPRPEAITLSFSSSEERITYA